MSHPAELIHRGMHIPDTDGKIGGWQRYEKHVFLHIQSLDPQQSKNKQKHNYIYF
jgi:hypothetical protein